MHSLRQSLIVLAGLASWAGSAWAGPGVIVQSRVEAFAAPSREARVAAELGLGAQVCVLDRTNHDGVLIQRLGWLAVRLPGGVGYVPVETVDVAAPAPDVQDCGATTSPPAAPSPSQRQPLGLAAAGGSRPAETAVSARPATSASDGASIGPPARVAGVFVPLLPARFLMNMGSGIAWLDKHAAELQAIGDSGPTFNFAAGLLIWDVLQVSTALSFTFPSDDRSFTQQVVPETGGGSPHTAESSLNVVNYSIAAGVHTPFLALGTTNGDWVATAAFAEYGSAGVAGGRSISNCVDCYKEDLTLPGGTFWRVGLDLLVPSHKPTFSWGLTVSYQRYSADAGFVDELRFGLSGWVHSRHR